MKNFVGFILLVFSVTTFAQSEDSKIVSKLSLAGPWSCEVVDSVVGENRAFYEAFNNAQFEVASAVEARKFSTLLTNVMKVKSISRAFKANIDGEKTIVFLTERNDENASYFATKFDIFVFVAGQTFTFPLQHKKASEFKKGFLEFKLDTGVSKTEAKCRVNLLP